MPSSALQDEALYNDPMGTYDYDPYLGTRQYQADYHETPYLCPQGYLPTELTFPDDDALRDMCQDYGTDPTSNEELFDALAKDL